ncbi:MAG TPA: tryptophan--tRNA ligase [Alphaproteobacteria bacterium]|nr:tryptophan--tRNA ligase [Alphaproteobacteria bacterium]
MQRILSGMQPTGNLHLGNYLGALKNWVKLQDKAECYYCVVDLHAITVPQDPAKLKNAVRETAAAYIAAGIDTKKSTLFVQSAVPAHTELMWILSTYTPLGWLNRMTQYKDKSASSRDLELLGLYAYPVLMAADILAYKATHVPVGEDQKQHLELTRDIAQAFNRAVKDEYFKLPEPQILGEATRVMSLRDGTKKMSKSDESDYSRINLTDDADTIVKKFKKATTDSDVLPDNVKDLAARAEADNLVTIYAALNETTKAAVLKEYAGSGWGKFKPALADLAVAKLAPITDKMRELMKNPAEIDQILIRGAEHANALTQKHMREIKDLVGLWNLM